MKKKIDAVILRMWLLLGIFGVLPVAEALAGAQVAVPLRSSGALQTMFRHQRSAAPAVNTVEQPAATAVPVFTYRVSGARTLSPVQGYYGTARDGQGYGVPASGFVTGGAVASAFYAVRRPQASVGEVTAGVVAPRIGHRKVYHSGAETDGNGNYYDEEAEDWLPVPGGGGTGSWPGGIEAAGTYYGQTQRGNDGKSYWWNGTMWVDYTIAEPDSPTPLGGVPVWFMLLLAAGYAGRKHAFVLPYRNLWNRNCRKR